MQNGRLLLRWDSGEFALESPPLNDGKWHLVEVKWMQGEIWLNVDYGLYEETAVADTKLQGLYIGKVSVGGLENSSSITPLIGCIKV